LDGLEGAKMWAGDEVEGGRADFGSWAVEKRRWAKLRWAGGFGARWLSGRKGGVGSDSPDFGEWAESVHGPKRRK
jgi:hypothetical protein